MTHSFQSLSLDQLAGANLNLNHPLREYIVTLSSDEPTYILAANAEEAAWHALELSEDREAVLIDERLTDEW